MKSINRVFSFLFFVFLFACSASEPTAEEDDMVNSGFNVGGQYMYFKAGVYHLNSTGNDDDYAQVTFYALEKSHTTD